MLIRHLILVSLFCGASLSVAQAPVGNIRVATESWDTFTNKDGTGLFFEITKAIFEPHDISLEITFVPYARALRLIETKQVDAMYGTYSTEEEGKPYLFTPKNPIDAEQTVALYKKHIIAEWQGLASLNNKHVSWVRGYDYDDALSVDWGPVTEVIDTAQGLNMLRNGRFDVFIDHKIELRNALTNQGFEMTGYDMSTLITKHLYMAFSQTEKSRSLAKIYDQEFSKLLSEGVIEEIFRKYERELPYLN